MIPPDYNEILRLLALAQEDWSSQGRVTRRTCHKLFKVLPGNMWRAMFVQLREYQDPMSRMKGVAFLDCLSEWKKCAKWANKRDPFYDRITGRPMQ